MWNRFPVVNSDMRNLNVNENDGRASQHATLIRTCQARVILLCGRSAELVIRQAFSNYEEYRLMLRGLEYTMYIIDTESTGAVSKRVLIGCPELPTDPKKWWARNTEGTRIVRLCEAIRFAMSTTDTKGIRPYVVESSSILQRIFTLEREAQLGHQPKLTTETLDGSIKA